MLENDWDFLTTEVTFEGNLTSMGSDNFRRVHKWNVYNQLSVVFEKGEEKVSY